MVIRHVNFGATHIAPVSWHHFLDMQYDERILSLSCVANNKQKHPYTGAWACCFMPTQGPFSNKKTCEGIERYQYFVVISDYHIKLYLISKYSVLICPKLLLWKKFLHKILKETHCVSLNYFYQSKAQTEDDTVILPLVASS